MKTWRVSLVALAVLLGAATAFATTRGVYVNGQVHLCYLNGQTISHEACNVDPSTWMLSPLPGHADATLPFAGYRYTAMTYGEGIAVFNNQLFYAFVANNAFSSSAPLHAYVARFDLPTSTWAGVKDLGTVHMDNKSKGHNSGACVAVFNNTLNVFTDSGVYTSADGTSWAAHPALLSSNYQPLDAITIFPPDEDPRILLLVGYSGDVSNIYNTLDTELWNGKFGSDSQVYGMGVSLGELVYGHAALFQGTFAGGNSFSAGAKAPVIQLFVNSAASDGPGEVRRAEWTYSATGGSWSVDPHKLTHDSIDNLISFPWYTTECYPASESTVVDHIQRQTLVINYYQCTSSKCSDHEWKSMAFTSDAMVPQDKDVAITCGSWGGSGTDTGSSTDPADMATLRKYWSLVGVVLGSPPFAVNGLDDYEIENISNVQYGQDQGVQVQHAQEWENSVLFSAGLQVHAGFFDGLLKIEDQLDLGYKHAWQTAHEDTSSSSIGFDIEMGTVASNPDNLEDLGRFGWAIFNVPTVIVQDYALYAYDYSVQTMSGTYLNQDLHSTQVLPDGLSVLPFSFELENPGGPNDEVPGLLAGMGPFPKSTDLDQWTATWESAGGGPWTTVLGTGGNLEPKVNPVKFSQGQNVSVTFSKDSETVDSSGQTTSVDISDELGMEVGTKLRGFKADLKAGYEGQFSTKVTNSTSFSSEVTAGLGMKPCESPGPGCVSSLTVQPFWLQATDVTAPWIPAGYNQQLPWCMAWQVTASTLDDGGQSGLCSAPARISGKAVGGAGAVREEGGALEAAAAGGRYTIEGGRLAWLDSDGVETPIPLTADGFDPASGATVSINRHAWSSAQAEGKWSRQGQVWTFKTKASAHSEVATLKLDFAGRTWDFDLSKTDLSTPFRAAESRAHLKLNVNGRYTFYCDVQPQVQVRWDFKRAANRADAMDVFRYSGTYDASTGEGSLLLKGDLPQTLDTFGDVAFEVNGHRFDVPLLAHKDFQWAFDGRKVLQYDKEGTHVTVDFKEKTWKAQFKHAAFHRLAAPRWGSARLRILVCGVPWFSEELPVTDYTTKMKFKG